MTILRYIHDRYMCAAEVRTANHDLDNVSVGLLVCIWIGSQHPHLEHDLNIERRSKMTLRDIVAFQYFPLTLNVCFKLKP